MTIEARDRGRDGLSSQEVEGRWNTLMQVEWAPLELTRFIHDRRTFPVFRERIFRILLAPSPDYSTLPFRVNVRGKPLSAGESNLYFLGELKGENAGLAARIVAENITTVRGVLSKGHKEEMKTSRQSLHFYQRAILDLLPVLPREEAVRLFGSFDLQEFFWREKEQNDRYDELSLKGILTRRELADSWKREILMQMQAHIREEQASKATVVPSTLDRYTNMLLNELHDRNGYLLIGKDLYRDELLFVMGCLPSNRAIFPIQKLDRAIWVFDRNTPEDHEFIRRQILGRDKKGNRNFQVEYKLFADMAKRLIKRFPKDRQLVEYLQEQLGSYAAVEAKRYKERADEAQTTDECHRKKRAATEGLLKKPRFPFIRR